MDETLERLADRFQPRHLLNDLLDLWQTRRKSDAAGATGEAVRETFRRASETLKCQIRDHPMPTLLIGAGITWLILNPARASTERHESSEALDDFGSEPYDGVTEDYGNEAEVEAMGYGMGTGGMAAGSTAGEDTGGSGGKGSNLAAKVKRKVRRGAHELRQRAREQGREIRERAENAGHQMKDRMREGYHHTEERLRAGYDRAREHVRETADMHPLATGAACLGLGLLAGLLLPRTSKEDEWFGDAADAMKHRVGQASRDLMDRGKHVAKAATDAAKSEAERQGLTPEHLKERLRAVGAEAQEAAKRTAEKEGVIPESTRGSAQTSPGSAQGWPGEKTGGPSA